MEKELLKKIMFKKGVSVRNLAKMTGILPLKLCFKLIGIAEFNLDEIKRIAKALVLTDSEVECIFFGK